MSSAIGGSACNRTSKGSFDAMAISDFKLVQPQLLQVMIAFSFLSDKNTDKRDKNECREKEI
jgi:hypothetical protein